MSDNDKQSSSESWDTYWRGTRDSQAFADDGVSHPAVEAFWHEFFHAVRAEFSSPRIIDIAGGSGAVIEQAQSVFADQQPDLTSLDVSKAAVAKIEERFPEVHGIVADARNTGLASASFDIAVSQFGVEYAGVTAISEAGRLVGVDGKLALLLHYHDGAIFRECANSLDAIRRTQDAEFISRAHDMFEAGFRAVKGANRSEYEAAGKLLVPAIAELDAIFEQYGEHVAGDTIASIYADVGRIHSELHHYKAKDVLTWLLTMRDELQAFAGRMQSMCDCALDREAIDAVCEQLQSNGFTVDQCAALTTEDMPSLAWMLIATRREPEELIGLSEQEVQEKFAAWTRRQIDASLGYVIDRSLFDSELLESKPAWSLPLQVLISQVREQGEEHRFVWTICGDVPADYLDSDVASTPRDAARHFAMKWQLDAARDPQNEATLATRAEFLFRAVNDDTLW
jgi:SAM-dependent methyltransferase